MSAIYDAHMECVFCLRVAAGEVIAGYADSVAFFDKFPGHVLIIPPLGRLGFDRRRRARRRQDLRPAGAPPLPDDLVTRLQCRSVIEENQGRLRIDPKVVHIGIRPRLEGAGLT